MTTDRPHDVGVTVCLSCGWERTGTELGAHFVPTDDGLRCRLAVEADAARQRDTAEWRSVRRSIRAAVRRGELVRIR